MSDDGAIEDGERRRGWAILDLSLLRDPPLWLSATVYGIAAAFSAFVVLTALLLVLRTFLPVWSLERLTGEESRNLFIAIGVIVAAPFAIWRIVLSHWNARAAQEQARIARENHFTTLFTKAVEQLGAMREVKVTENVGEEGKPKYEAVTRTEPNVEVRLGAIYALERIARDSRRDHWPIMETLCAYVRENGREPLPLPDEVRDRARHRDGAISCWVETLAPPRADVQTALTVIGRRRSAFDGKGRRLDLRGAGLQRADLAGLEFRSAAFVGARLEGASLCEAHLEGIVLDGACLAGAHLREAHLEGAHLCEARLEGAILNEAHLAGAYLREAHLEGASSDRALLEGANLERAHLEGISLVRAHLEGAFLTEARLADANLTEAHLGAVLLEEIDLSSCDGLNEGQLAGTFGYRVRLSEGLTSPADWLSEDASEADVNAFSIRWAQARQGALMWRQVQKATGE